MLAGWWTECIDKLGTGCCTMERKRGGDFITYIGRNYGEGGGLQSCMLTSMPPILPPSKMSSSSAAGPV